ncbi:hypothetical protein CVD28_07805 [Bacillus sp. M6-12]|uniref:hypothetical protein n=1 Tax=Bacillus sp. M6-12 TaxID=2054166 RepID=UPI000C76A816|nr:hypothetical protein [Bacillus sp. M6-12]PLS18186.1 hypothetical protein CVD28_07805 [Bacillus sp. M6-12]
MKKIGFKLTYSRWLNTHSRDHKEYQRRKRYNWGILSKINFNPIDYNKVQEIYTHDTNQVYLGTAEIIDHTFNIQLERHIFNLKVFEFKKQEISEFLVVFNKDGLPITIYQTNDPIKNLKEKFIAGEISDVNQMIDKKNAKDIFTDIVEVLLKENFDNPFNRYEVFERKIIKNSTFKFNENEVFHKIKAKNVIDFSIGREHWVITNLKFNKALSEGIKLSSQCKKLTSIYLFDNLNQQKVIRDNTEIVSIFTYFGNESVSKFSRSLIKLIELSSK